MGCHGLSWAVLSYLTFLKRVVFSIKTDTALAWLFLRYTLLHFCGIKCRVYSSQYARADFTQAEINPKIPMVCLQCKEPLTEYAT